MHYRPMSKSPRVITSSFNTQCAETGKQIKTGDYCVYYPSVKKVYCMDSEQAREYREMKADEASGYSY